MNRLRFSLLADGPHDQRLIRVIEWLVRDLRPTMLVDSQWVDLGRLRRPPKELAKRIAAALDLYPCDVLFVHRDAERQPPELRQGEVADATRESGAGAPTIAVVPVRMTEAWLLFDEPAIRAAAENPNGTMPLDLPRRQTLESLADPRDVLYSRLRTASGLSGRRLERFAAAQAAVRLVDFMDDFSPLRALSAFRQLEADLRHFLDRAGS